MKNVKFYGLITLVVLSLSFSYVGCDGGGGGGGGAGGGVDPGTAPTILSVKCFKIVDGVPIESLIFDTDDLFNWNITANDPDLDMDTLFLSTFLGPDYDTPYEPDIEMVLPSQLDPTMEYFFIEPIKLTEIEAGNWRLCIWIVDIAGNESNEFCVNIVVNDVAALKAKLNKSLAPESVFDWSNKTIEGDAIE